MRVASVGDDEFLRSLFDEVRAADLADVEPAQLRSLLTIQYRGRAAQHAKAHPNAIDHIIEADGQPVGRILVDETDLDIHVIDIAVAEAARARGIGSDVLRTWCDRADASGRTVSVMVAPSSPARRLYERLGLEAVAEDQSVVRMRRRPASD